MRSLSAFGITISFLIIVVFIVVLMAIVLFQEKCREGPESPAYHRLKGEFEVYKAEAEKRAEELEESDVSTEKENAELRDEIDELEISKGRILAESAERNKKIFEQELELEVLQEKESGIQDDKELIFNLRLQVTTLQSNFSLAIEDRDKEKKARKKSDAQVLKLEAIIVLRDETIGKLRPALAAERVARLAAEDVIATGEKNTVFYKIGKFVGNGFKAYGIYSAVRDTVKVVGK